VRCPISSAIFLCLNHCSFQLERASNHDRLLLSR
jgi:hypothetical protein